LGHDHSAVNVTFAPEDSFVLTSELIEMDILFRQKALNVKDKGKFNSRPSKF
jgi:hypothetical protein